MPTQRKDLLKTDDSSGHIKIRVHKNETTDFNLSDFVHILYLLKKTTPKPPDIAAQKTLSHVPLHVNHPPRANRSVVSQEHRLYMAISITAPLGVLALYS